MQRDEQDPTIMDLDPEKSLESQRPSKKSDDDDGPPLNEDPKYAKYFKMLKMVRLLCVEMSIYMTIVTNSLPRLSYLGFAKRSCSECYATR